MIAFDDLTACLWKTASLPREEFSAVRESVDLHSGDAVIVESCQRLEVYAFEDCQCGAPLRLHGRDALVHMAAVAAGLHSAVLGEEQVMGQVRTSLVDSPPPLREAGDIAIAAARELRQSTRVNTDSGHLLDRGLAMANVDAGDSMLILGTGHMARLIARRGQYLGFERIVIAGRTKPVAAWFEDGQFDFAPLDSLPEMPAFDVVVGCLGSNAPVLDVRAGLPPIRSLILDLGTPANFCGAAAAPLLDIAKLLEAGQHHTNRRRTRLLEELGAIIDRRLAMAASTRTSPVGAFRASIERIRQREAQRIRHLHPEIAPETVEAITRALVNQIFHLPSERLRRIDDAEWHERFVALFSEEAEPAAERVRQ